MAKKQTKKNTKPEYSFLCAEVTSYSAYVDAGINYNVKDKHHRDVDDKVYSFGSWVEIEAICSYQEDQENHTCAITVYGNDHRRDLDFDLKLKDCHVIDDNWQPVYKKVRGKEFLEPVYEIPKGIGGLEWSKSEKHWQGAVWVPPRTATDMMVLLPNVKPLYINAHLLKIKRYYHVVNLSLQTNDPANS